MRDQTRFNFHLKLTTESVSVSRFSYVSYDFFILHSSHLRNLVLYNSPNIYYKAYSKQIWLGKEKKEYSCEALQNIHRGGAGRMSSKKHCYDVAVTAQAFYPFGILYKAHTTSLPGYREH